MWRTFAATAIFAALSLGPAGSLSAQDTAVTAEDAIDNARRSYGPPPPTQNCAKPAENQSDSEIVVCAQQQKDYSEFRVQGTSELDPNSKEALNDGIPRAPDVGGDGIFKGKATVTGGCFLQGCPPPPAYIVNFEDLPDAPEGSDADKIAKGEKKAD